jgi:tetratricopeptide (TPR) repeat protein
MTARKSKIYDDREAWEMIWRQEKDGFNREYLYVVEGNVLYAAGAYEDAARFYEKALELNPELRSALLNSLFAYAKVKDFKKHSSVLKRVLSVRALMPQALATIGNSFVILGDLDSADSYYHELASQPGWERKAEYYRSMFLYDQGMFEKALVSALAAVEENPFDTSMRFHLSLCYSAAGKKEAALEVVAEINEEPEWIRFYRFTLQRDTGMHEAASRTLMQISAEYFDDPEELEQALEFAKEQRDLVLLRHLRARA